MACTKTQLASAINSYASARATGDANLINFGASMVTQLLDTLEFEPDDDTPGAAVPAAEALEEAPV